MGKTLRVPLMVAALAVLPQTAFASCEASEMHRHSFEMSTFEAVELNALAGGEVSGALDLDAAESGK